MHGAEPSQLTRPDDPSHGPDVGTVALRVAAQQLDPVLFRGQDHALRLLEGNGHGFFHHDVLPALRRDDRVGRVKLVWRGDPDGFDLGIITEFFDALVGPRAVSLMKYLQDARVDVCPRH